MHAPLRTLPQAVMRVRVPATDEAVSIGLARILETSRQCGLREALRTDLGIVLGEVLNNIVEHAVPQGVEGWIDVEVTRAEGRLQVETIDAGAPLPPQLLGGAALPDMGNTPLDLPEGGFGWFIIHALARDMTYERAGGRNHLSFFLEEGGEGPRPDAGADPAIGKAAIPL